MKKLTDEQIRQLRENASDYLSRLQDGEDIRSILAKIYVDSLDGKTEKQGLLIADTILKSVREFDADYAEARDDVDKFLKKTMDKISKDKNCAERCQYWLKLTAGIAAAARVANGEEVDKDALIAELEAITVTEEQATQEMEEDLRAQAKEAIMNSGIMLGSLAENAEAFAAAGTAEEATEMLLGIAGRDVEYRAIIAMQAYTGIISGMYDDMPVNMGAAQVATLVCAQVEEARILEAVGNGSLAVDVAAAILGVLGIVVLVDVFMGIAAVGVVAALNIYSGILAVPAIIMVCAGLCKLFFTAVDKWSDLAQDVAKFTAGVIANIVKGAQAVAGYVRRNIVPNIVAMAKAAWEKVRAFIAGGSRVKEDAGEIVAEPAQ